ncbi:hypothetical protein EU245_12350 [Lentibacillus lipolyticus]|nr:hypothetical protein EU245_12350 [Lentibacillus lipolyticus]
MVFRTETYINNALDSIDLDNGETLEVASGTDLSTFFGNLTTAEARELVGAEIKFDTNNSGEAIGIEAVVLEEKTYDADVINELVQNFVGISIEGVNGSQDDIVEGDIDITVEGVTLKYFTIDGSLTVSEDDFTSVENHIVDDNGSGDVTVTGNNASFNTHIDGDVDTSGEGNTFTNVEVGNDFIVSGGLATVEDTTIENDFEVQSGSEVTVKGSTTSATQDFQGTVDVTDAEDEDIVEKGEEANTEVDEATVDAAITALQGADWDSVAEGTNVVTLAEEIVDNDDITIELADTADKEVVDEDGDVVGADEDGDVVGADEDTANIEFDVTVGETTDTTDTIAVTLTASEDNQEIIDAVNEATTQVQLLEALEADVFTDVNVDLIAEYQEAIDGATTDTVAKIQSEIDDVNVAAAVDAEIAEIEALVLEETSISEFNLEFGDATSEELSDVYDAIESAINNDEVLSFLEEYFPFNEEELPNYLEASNVKTAFSGSTTNEDAIEIYNELIEKLQVAYDSDLSNVE